MKKAITSFKTIFVIVILLLMNKTAFADGGNSIANAVAITWSNYSSTITAGETEYYKFSATTGYSYCIYSTSQTGTLDIMYDIVNSSGTVVCGYGWGNLSTGTGNNGTFFTCPATGTYYIKLYAGNNTQTGSVTMSIRQSSSTTTGLRFLATPTCTNTVMGGTMTVSGSIINPWAAVIGKYWQFIQVYINGTLATITNANWNNFTAAANATTSFAFNIDLTTANGAVAGTNTVVIKAVAMNPYNTEAQDTKSTTITVSAAAVAQTITFNALTAHTYGDAPFTVSATGGASGNPVTFTSSDPTVATCTGTNGATVTVLKTGSCAIYANQAGNTFYTAAPQVSQTLTVNPKSVTITGVSAATKEYDGTATATLGGGAVTTGVGTETLAVTAGTGAFADKNVGTKAVTATGYALADGTNGGLASNYTLSAQPTVANQSITAKAVTITGVTAASKEFDGTKTAVLSGGAVSTGVGTETLSITAGTGTFADGYAGSSKVVTATGYALADGTNGGLASNYVLSAQPIVPNQTITTKAITITPVANQKKVYGDANPSAYTYTATPALLTGDVFAGALTRTAGENALTYPIQLGTLHANGNYALTFVSANFEITKATLKATAVDTSRVQYQANPVFRLKYEGFVNGENKSVLTAEPSISCPATTDAVPGTYPIYLITTGSAVNYSIIPVNGTLTVTRGTTTAIIESQSGIMNVYPNPTSDFIQISGISKKENYKIFDMLGTEKLNGVVWGSENINVMNLSNGLYLLKLDNGNTMNFIKK